MKNPKRLLYRAMLLILLFAAMIILALAGETYAVILAFLLLVVKGVLCVKYAAVAAVP